MALIPPTLDYTDKDRASLVARLRNLIRQAFPTWTEESVANFGNILVELAAHVGDVLAFLVDNWARESRISTARLRRSLLGIAKMLSFTPSTQSAASVDETFTLAAALAGTLTIPKGDTVSTEQVTDPVVFQLLEDLVFAPGETVKTATVQNSEFADDQLLSDGRPNQTYRLTKIPFIEDTLSFTAANGVYSVVSDFLDSTSTDRHIVITVDEEGRATITTGNGINGEIPVGTIATEYRTGGGGGDRNVEAGTLNVLDSRYEDDLGNPADITTTNAAAASGGAPRESNAQIRQRAPREGRVLNRSVAREDYEIVAEGVSGVARALHLTRNQDLGVAENAGILFVVPEGGGVASSALLDAVDDEFEPVTGDRPHFNTYNLSTQTAAYQNVAVTARVFKRPGNTAASVKADIAAALTEFFAVEIAASALLAADPALAATLGITAADGDALIKNPRVDFGFFYKDTNGDPSGEFPWSDVLNAVRDVPSVQRIDPNSGFLLDGVQDDVTIGTFRFPQLGNVIVIDADTGQTVP